MKPDFSTAIFDLDGTLLDSMFVWANVDRIFFEKRSLPLSEEYGRALAGLSFQESAEYTVTYYGLKERTEDILEEWMQLAEYEYANTVTLKPGAREYLTYLRRSGVRLCVATALPERLYRPCLEHLGIIDLFDVLCSTDDTGGRGKAKGEVFLLACERAGSRPGNCVVFEDVLTGITGAKYAGMRAICVRDHAARKDADLIAAAADLVIDSYYDLLGDRRVVIFTARCDGDPSIAYADRRNDDYIICADAGWKIARAINAEADLVIGDFDTADAPDYGNVIRHPIEKDDTDTMLCARYALEMGFRDILIIGGLGGRIDHTIANIQTLAYIAVRGARCMISDGKTNVFAVHSDSIRVPAAPGKLAVFAFGGRAEGVSIRGTKYEAKDILLTPDLPLGMGNDFAADHADITVREGTLIITCDLFRE